MGFHSVFLLCLLTYSSVIGQWDEIVNRESKRLNLTSTQFRGSDKGALCDLEDGKQGVCVAHYQCKSGEVITDGAGLFDDRTASCDPAKRPPLVCCLNPEPDTTEANAANTPATSSNTPNTPATTHPKSTFNTCGWSNIGGLEEADRIADTSNSGFAKYGEFPFLVALIKKEGFTLSNVIVFGGGTIIHPSVVLTTAHKLKALKPADLMIRAGEHNIIDTEINPNQDRNVKRFIIHENYEMVSAYNNIALLILESPLVMGAVISPGCLGRVLPAPGTRCVSMGWGRTPTTTVKSNELKKIILPMISKTDCETAFRKIKFGYNFVLDPSLTCAGGERDVDTCKGDGGSPLVCSIAPERYAVYGLVSYGIGCGNTNPAVYANIPHLYDWISSKMLELGYGTNDYSYN